jgi:hypothetical protein
MRSNARIALLAPLVGALLALLAVSAPVAQAAPPVPFGVEKFSAANCTAAYEGCAGEETTIGPFEYWTPKETTSTEEKIQGYTQAAGHPAWGVTDFQANTEGTLPNEVPAGLAEGKVVKHVRTDVGPGVSTNPEAVPKCTMKAFDGNEKEEEAVPGSGFYLAPTCPESGSGSTVIGVNRVTVYAGPNGVTAGVSDLPLEGTAYNVEQPQGVASVFGVALKLPMALTKGSLEKAFAEKPLPEEEFPGTKVEKEAEKKGTEEAIEKAQYYAHTLINGNVEWAGNYHDYYEINVSTALPLISSRLVLKGNIGSTGNGGYITLPSNCAGRGPATTNTVTLTSTTGQVAPKTYETPVGTEGCKGEAGFTIPPFVPTFGLTPGAGETQSDLPDGITAELTVPHNPLPTELDSSQLRTAIVTLPEGMTLNPSAASGLKACTPAQIGIGTRNAVACPGESKLGEVTLTVPDLPASEPLTGDIYLGGTEPITGGANPAAPEYTIYLNAESARYGVDVRLEGKVTPNPTTGQVTTTFTENPEQPFSNIKLKFNGGALAPIANPLTCGTATATTSLVPYIGSFATESPSSSFTVDSNGKGGACASPLPFALTQSAVNQSPGYAGAKTSYTLNVGRADGQQYLSQIKTVLPEGLVGLIPSVTQCGEPQAANGECTSASQIGTVSVSAGAGPQPFGFKGNVYLTGPYGGAPFGLSIVVPAIAGPFNLGNVVTRGTINVEPYTARVVATSTLPTIVKGVPLRLKGISVEINKQGFLQSPTNCGALATETTLTSTLGATQSMSIPFQVNNCSALAFKPSFGSAAGAKTSKANGASLETTLNVPAGGANVKSVLVQLPKQLPSRLTTLQKACSEAVFNANPYTCPSGSFVGGVRANTPTLSAKLKGPAILVSHGGAAFPDLDLLLEGEGIRVILVGNTNIKNGITTTNFAAPPDVPVSSITVNLPIGAHSALTANGNVCANKLVMPTTIVGQNGTTFKQSTTIKVKNCPVRIVGNKVIGNTAYITVQTYAAGRISGSGSNLATVYRKLGKAEKTATLKVSLSRAGQRRGRPLKVKLRVGFVPKTKSVGNSASTTTVTFG